MKKKSYLLVNLLVAILLLQACKKEEAVVENKSATLKNSPYVTQVFDYLYAPGQQASLLPANANGADFVGEPWINNKSFTSLGGWGGYIVAGFDHAVQNSDGPDFCVYTQPSVSSEPGVVYVMEDSNGDGLPNDGEWMEIKGSEYNHPETLHNYKMTYYKPGSSGLVTWIDNRGNSGSLVPHYGTGSWWWQGYGDKTSITLSGERLPDAYFNSSKDPATEYWLTRPGLFQFGYAECYNNQDFNTKLKANFFDISSAVDASGQPAQLKSIRFIKVQSSVFQVAGWLNEVSTEVSGAADVHLLDEKSYK